MPTPELRSQGINRVSTGKIPLDRDGPISPVQMASPSPLFWLCRKSAVLQRMRRPNQPFGLTRHKPAAMVRAVQRAALPPRTAEEYLDERINRTPVSVHDFVRANRAVL
ncbi:MAG: hypothetical protein QOG14_4044 [Mycobacterium sp.]|jgi:hypothetical protein|nr:hypothetical protein [Mycobacterium sp.]